ncbi:MAG: CusA/CzcA family heavy metal efflux RND transporter [Tannerellaceae bacterium]|jgi:CzcA family heavy metal efflux pump|nr:CusA/CzcA family heavy metal efflux RND transporter [Tannerellaceae bacterium]
MLNKIIHYSLNNRMAVLVCGLLIMIWGTYSAMNTDVDVFPDLNAPTVVVMTEASGLAPEEVERLISFPVETAVNGAMNVRRVRSSSTTGFSVVWVEFDWGMDIYRARQIVSEKLSMVTESLPSNVGRPVIAPQSSILGEVMIIGLTSDSTSLRDLRTLADWTLRPRLLSTGGVAQVAVIGGEMKEYQILLSPERMKHYGITFDQVLDACRDMNRNVGGGILYNYDNEYIVRGSLATADAAEIGKSAVGTVNNAPVLLEDIATVLIGGKSPQIGLASVKGKAAVLLTVNKQPETGSINLTNKLDKAIEEIKKDLPADVNVSTDIFRQSSFIDSSIRNVKNSLIEGSLFVVVILFVFLMNVRTTLISLAAVPVSLIVSILALHYMGLTINTMSLGGMAISIGSLVDDAIVDVENVFRRMRENKALPESERLPVMKVIYEASCEVRLPILNSTLIIIVSFVPLFFLSGMEGKMLAPLGIAFIVALFASTVVALTLTPALCSFLLSKGGSGKFSESFVARKLKSVYGAMLLKAMDRKAVTLGSTFALLVIAIILFTSLGRNFLPPFNEGSFTINISALPGISLEESDKIGRRAEQLLMQVPEIQTMARKTGRAELDEHALGVNESEIEAPFLLKDRSREEVMTDVRDKLSTLSGANIEIGQPISHRIDAMLSGTKANIAIKVFGSDLNRMYATGKQIQSAIADVEGIADLNVEQQIERPQLTITPRRELLARYGITMPEFEEYLRVMLGGEVVSQVYDEGKYFDLTLKVADGNRAGIDEIGNLILDAPAGKIPLSYVAGIRSTVGPNTINRENAQRKLVVSANVSGRDMHGVVSDIRSRIDSRITPSLPEGYRIELGGQFESEQAAGRTLALTSALALLVIFLLLYHEFKDVRESFIILLNLPLALIGGVFILWLTRGEISIPAIIGFISLFGIATRNGMLLVSHYKHLMSEGMERKAAVIQGSLDRLNPILMTALTAALALVPLALRGHLPGNEIQSPMAIVILGGLLTSTFLNGFIVPIVYLYANKLRIKNY